VIRFKQGFGRLIRHRDDRGVVFILDSRVVKKGYGRMFLRSLPAVPVLAAPTAEVLTAMERFFAFSSLPPESLLPSPESRVPSPES
jgi:ATP-dependent DNA helicase DinG